MHVLTHKVGFALDVLWLIFLFYWLFLAFFTKKNVYKQSSFSRVFYIFVFLCAAVLLTSVGNLSLVLIPMTIYTKIAGIIICACGIAFAIWARTVIGKNWSGSIALKEDHELVVSGPYRIVRHPIYTGILIAFLGTVVALIPTLEGLIFLVIAGIAFWFKLRFEEKLMAWKFPEGYKRYRRRVKAALIPFLI